MRGLPRTHPGSQSLLSGVLVVAGGDSHEALIGASARVGASSEGRARRPSSREGSTRFVAQIDASMEILVTTSLPTP
jgi:hypothetical protein